ncbi:MAG: FG-GAP-like repeat-containing protein, partial [Gemmataceae bacterium]
FNRIRGFSATGDNSSNVGQNIGNANTGSGTSVVLYNPLTGASNGNVVPFPGFFGEVRVSRADTNGDGILDMVVSPGVGGTPTVKVIDSATGTTLTQFLAYDAKFTGGMFVSVSDVNNDGFSEIITGAGAGGGPHVKVFDGRSHAEVASFFAYTPGFTGGVSVATYDFDRDGTLDIVTGAGPGGGPHVKVFNGATLGLVKEFMAYTLNFTGGVYVAAGDFLSDGRYEIITGAGAGGGPHVKVWDYDTLNLVAEKMAYDNYTFPSGLVVDMLFGGGVRVGLADGNDDGIMDVIVGAGPGGGPHVKVLAGINLDVIRNFFSGEMSDSRGVFVGQ